MKKLIIAAVLLVTLCGCSAEQVFETISDVEIAPVIAQTRKVEIELPEDTAIYTMIADEENRMYLCGDYTVAVQTMGSGDLDRSLQMLTGFNRSALTVLETRQEDVQRYDFAWSTVSEAGEQISRGAILDDGQYHYAVTVMADSDKAAQLHDQMQKILDSVNID